MTVIMSTHSPSVIRATDKVLIFEDGCAKEYGVYSTLKT